MKSIEIYDVRIGDRVRWESAAGICCGEVTEITMNKTAAGDYVPWYTIVDLTRECVGAASPMPIANLCGRGSYLNMMKFVVLFRNKEAA